MSKVYNNLNVENTDKYISTISSILQQNWALWHRLCKDSSFKLPRRRSFDMQLLRGQTANIVVSDWTDDNEFLVKLSGTNIDRIFGYNRTGMTLKQFTEPQYYEDIYFFYMAQVLQPCAGFSRTKLSDVNGFVIELESLSFPLCDEKGKVRHIISFTEAISDKHHSSFIHTPGKISEYDTTETKFLDLGWGTPEMWIEEGNLQWKIGKLTNKSIAATKI